ncbi:ferritin-like protein [Frankia sp. AiPs1]|uniref:ferritin-like domain-containing protein n=1 Tax=Frankia sp. AiPs1 TaxID=573493 RepID=UPI0020445958|nr:ferritin-like protein [Frankia sp. AiPs1]MCM3923393.1 ferritin-like protein [Frankia sp. AiPs1]
MSRRRTIRETVENGVNDLAELQASLLTAIQLEFSTIPPYLCAQWSVTSADPSGVAGLIEKVATQEMLHFGLSCNMYTATGASLRGEIATPNFAPVYPVTGLPGGVHPELVVALAPLSEQALQTFLAIEYPEAGPVVPAPDLPPPPPPPVGPTIGQFYDAIAAGFKAVFPDGSLPTYPAPNQVTATRIGDDTLFAVNTVADALTAIDEITAQGEGTSASPDEGTFEPGTLAHYYTFAEIYYGRTLVSSGDTFEYAGTPIEMPAVHNFSAQPSAGPDQQTFITTFTTLMTNLEKCWRNEYLIETAISDMFILSKTGVLLIEAGITPQFTIT